MEESSSFDFESNPRSVRPTGWAGMRSKKLLAILSRWKSVFVRRTRMRFKARLDPFPRAAYERKRNPCTAIRCYSTIGGCALAFAARIESGVHSSESSFVAKDGNGDGTRPDGRFPTGERLASRFYLASEGTEVGIFSRAFPTVRVRALETVVEHVLRISPIVPVLLETNREE